MSRNSINKRELFFPITFGGSAVLHLIVLTSLSVSSLYTNELVTTPVSIDFISDFGGGSPSGVASSEPAPIPAPKVEQDEIKPSIPAKVEVAPKRSLSLESKKSLVKPVKPASLQVANSSAPELISTAASGEVSGAGIYDARARFGSGNGLGWGTIGILQARLLAAPKPRYPYAARRAGFEGRVTLAVTVGENGKVREAQIRKSSGRDDCDRSAIETVQNSWSFSPAVKNGVPIQANAEVVVVYELS